MRSLLLGVSVGVFASGCIAIPDGSNSLVAGNNTALASCGAISAQAHAVAAVPAASECRDVAVYQQTYQETQSVIHSERELAETRTRIYWLAMRMDKAAKAIQKTERRLVSSPDAVTRDALNSQLQVLREKHAEISADHQRLSLREQSQSQDLQALASATK